MRFGGIFPRNFVTSGLRGLAFSRQGYGASDPIPLPRPIDFMHHEGLIVLPKLFDAAGIDQAILIGHSDGGSISLINAGGVRDARVKAVITLAAHVFNEDITVQRIAEAKTAYETETSANDSQNIMATT